jgi:hypothetical protein
MKEWKMKANIVSFFRKSGSSTKKMEENIPLSSTFFHFRLVYFFRNNSLFLFLPEENTLPNSPLEKKTTAYTGINNLIARARSTGRELKERSR